MLTLILAESALETIPESLWNHPAIKRFSRAHHKHPRHVLLDRSYHHAAMERLEDDERRGRPDIVHFALLEALGSPLNKEDQLAVYVHTISDYTIEVHHDARLPRNYSRFVSLIEQLFEFGYVPPKEKQKSLLTLKHQTLPELIRKVKPTYLLALSRIGTPRILEEAISDLAKNNSAAVLIGGFPKGHLSQTAIRLADEVACIDSEMLETWTVVARVVYEFERALSLPKKRVEKA